MMLVPYARILKLFLKGHNLASPGKQVAAPEFTNPEGFTLYSCRPTAAVCVPEKPTVQPEDERWTDPEGRP